ncbi:MAG TPA: hypothetical protein DEG17_02850 [Cyanobacteria bacterium UBA11149]|nr:hypothetical protein [Cyanobacteria bacterium UBA11367]HBE56677.1 hypothetical protein [Cyanobacteria bacterium UBA11366]HBK66377.1 hypothetical protein [Cyanobacteria bacterium UBA11166]HBR74143.1 hypothetical protein [Cyanobacteria bacterium UBA11159]HBS72161.1 hypothetical protein [Cyanobacteria bacterium UBA11153]HBW87844.1 hypothetical protein [Cyanobacteria bacterium UBA11149]HCA93676.1 hypothetical protein [Cyanobacteria bacterium UBA9226]
MGEGIGGQDIWGNSLTNEERWNHFKSGALGSGLSLLGGGAALGKLGVLSQPTLAGVATYGTFSDGQDIGAAISGRDIEGNSLSIPDRLGRGGMGLLGALDLASPGGKYPLTPESHRNVGGKLNETIPHPEGLNLPSSHLPTTKNATPAIPLIPPHSQGEINLPSVIPNQGGKTATHFHQPEIEPGVVAKEKTHDGHEIKVLKDGRVVRCSDCGEIRIQYENILAERDDLRQRLDDIEGLNNPEEKAAQARELARELADIHQENSLKDSVHKDAEGIIEEESKKGEKEAKKSLKEKAATARASWEDIISEAFQNLKATKDNAPGTYTSEKFPGFELKERRLESSETIMTISDPDIFMGNIKRIYKDSGNPLHPKMEEKIRKWISEAGREFSTKAQIPGLHAEVQAVNNLLNRLDEAGVEITDEILARIQVAVYRVAPGSPEIKQGDHFPACKNCKNILKGFNILTGEVSD